MENIKQLEQRLDSFDAGERREALEGLWAQVEKGQVELPQPSRRVNLHCHTFFSFNSYGYSPSKFAWLARKEGLAVAGTVDFDVLDALEEFRGACRLIGLKGVSGLETRVYVPEFRTRQINSPGEPGISYHMAVGFASANIGGQAGEFLRHLRETVRLRNEELMERVNTYLAPVTLDYEADVLPLTPAGNATERHICLAYAQKAQAMFGQGQKLANYWTEKLGLEAAGLGLPAGRDLLNAIRAKTMKRGGVGYVQPQAGSFPGMAETNEFILSTGAIPTLTWLNGLSEGEQAIEELLDVGMSTGVAAFNIIPDRNFTEGVKDEKLAKLYEVVKIVEKRGLPIFVGTEMNSPGQKFVDSFETAELAPLTEVFLRGAFIAYGHTLLLRHCGMGYVSDWAGRHFSDPKDKNAFYEKVGKMLDPAKKDILDTLAADANPEDVLQKIQE